MRRHSHPSTRTSRPSVSGAPPEQPLRGRVTTATAPGFLGGLPVTQHHPPCYTQGSICANWAWATFSKAPGEGVTPSEFGDMTLEMVKSGVKS